MSTESARSDHAGLGQAMANVDQQEAEDEQEENIATGTEQAMADVLPPVFSTHSNATRNRVLAEQHTLRAIIADLDDKIAALNAERTDAMLAYSGLEANRRALENGREETKR